ncbi:MAG: Mur ligase family protein, partial [Myxococcota bacterium]
THGKTTTTSMLAWVLTHARRDPNFMVGGIAGNFGSNFRLGGGELFVIEGDEYDTAYFDKVPKFWHYAPTRATINNLEFDHADIYDSVADIEHVFRVLVSMLPVDGSLWVNGDDRRAMDVSAGAPCTRRTFGLGEDNDLRATDLSFADETSAEVIFDGQSLGRFAIHAPGDFNVRNMLGALALAMDEGVDVEAAREGFASFVPTRKRQELVGQVDDILVFDDFAHHPTAVGKTLEAMRARFPDRRIWAIFEAKSNTSRRRVFQDAYVPALRIADEVVLSKPWKRDEGLPKDQLLDIDQLLADIEADGGPKAVLLPEVGAIAAHVGAHAKDGDVIVGLSGSAFDGVHQKILDALRSR